MKKLKKLIGKLATKVSVFAGNPAALSMALLMVLFWSLLGPVCGFSDSWQLFINTTTTIITFILALSIQFTQNRDSKALHFKINKLLSNTEDLQETLDQIEKELDSD